MRGGGEGHLGREDHMSERRETRSSIECKRGTCCSLGAARILSIGIGGPGEPDRGEIIETPV